MHKAIFSDVELSDDNETGAQFMALVEDLLENELVKQLGDFGQHVNTTRLQHSINVAYYTFLICRKLNWRVEEATRAALLHDLFHYNWEENKEEGWHPAVHPVKALENAQTICEITPLMADGIVKHMWPLTIKLPKYKESWAITMMDKYCATLEVMESVVMNIRYSKSLRYAIYLMAYLHFN